jgi:hypothetical protein
MTEDKDKKAIEGILIMALLFAVGVGIGTQNFGWGLAAFAAFATLEACLMSVFE